MTPRDRAGGPPGKREAAGDARHRQGFPTPSGGSPARPERRRPAWLAMPHIATPRAPGRKPWEAVSMSHYRRSLVLARVKPSGPKRTPPLPLEPKRRDRPSRLPEPRPVLMFWQGLGAGAGRFVTRTVLAANGATKTMVR